MADAVSATALTGRREQKVLLASCRPDFLKPCESMTYEALLLPQPPTKEFFCPKFALIPFRWVNERPDLCSNTPEKFRANLGQGVAAVVADEHFCPLILTRGIPHPAACCSRIPFPSGHHLYLS